MIQCAGEPTRGLQTSPCKSHTTQPTSLPGSRISMTPAQHTAAKQTLTKRNTFTQHKHTASGTLKGVRTPQDSVQRCVSTRV